MRSGRFLIVALAMCLLAAHGAGGQSPPPPCPAGVAYQPTFDALDIDEFPGTTLVATHSVQVTVDLGGADNIALSVPGIDGVQKGNQLTFSSDTPGTVTVNATWTQLDATERATCSGSASTALQLIPATPIGRFKSRDYGEKINLKYSLNYIFGVDLGPTADLRPLLIQWRGWRRSKLPGASLPFKTLTAPLRRGDHGYHEEEFKLALPRMLFQMTATHDIVAVHVDSITSTHHPRPVAYDIEVSQAGRLLARFRLAGECSAFNCQMKTVKVQR
jgi:hypothetical protein